MRTALKMVLPLIVSVAVVSMLFAWYQVRTERRILRSDLSRRAEILGEALQESVQPLLDHAPDKNMQRLVERFPTVHAQFASAVPERPFVYAPRLSFRSAAIAGRRWSASTAARSTCRFWSWRRFGSD